MPFLFMKTPAMPMCCVVLHLQKQVGPRPSRSALAEAYRVTTVRVGSVFKLLAQNRSRSITNTAGYFPYTTIYI